MKRGIFFFTSLAGMIGAAVLLWQQQYEFAVYTAFFAWFININGVMKATGTKEILAAVLTPTLLGICLLPVPISIALPVYAASGFFLGLTGAIRMLVFSKIGYLKALFIEPAMTLIGGGLYFYANLYYPMGWMGWTFMGIVFAFSIFLTLMAIAGAKKLTGLTKENKFKVGIGHPAPDFKLMDHTGEETVLSNFKEKSNVLLIFVRGDWCPSCHIMLRTYQRNKEKFAEKNVTIMAIGPDPVGINRQMVEEMGVQYKILSDADLACSRTYGIALEPHGKPPKDTTTPLPASFLISSDGILRYTSRADDPGQILNPSDIFPILSNLN